MKSYYYVEHRVTGTIKGESSVLGPKLYTSPAHAISRNGGSGRVTRENWDKFYKLHRVDIGKEIDLPNEKN